MSDSRNGKHRAGNVRMGIYTTPFRKAVAVLVAEALDCTLTEVIWEGIQRLAISLGIIDSNGNVTPEYKDRLDLAQDTVSQSEVNG